MRATPVAVSVKPVIHAIPALVLFGVLIGVTTVFFGFGGGFVVVPVIYGIAADRPDAMHVAVATSTAVMVVNASVATLTSRGSGLIRREYVWPLAGFVAIGAAVGAWAATLASESLVHLLFVAYLIVTIVDSLVRKGFLGRSTEPRPLGKWVASGGGIGIGAVASFLGVGGSVMTVPLLRRRGLTMAAATAMANPLSIPIAVVGTLVYALPHHGSTSGTIGYVDVVAAGVLLAASLPTITIARRFVRRVPDRTHAIAYIVLLIVSLIAMVAV
ncbi:hypothetical protein SAMN04490220_5354 [Rhodococcus jostii]|uniref:Probable membrane transporter protein n=1 Tax=Rhodococcus jostii TaxID=132919 RepID=A0A1H5D2D5_RHOJO|nr:hypothetical protein SAMN04490220_5354 [Rhodococcus jostii]